MKITSELRVASAAGEAYSGNQQEVTLQTDDVIKLLGKIRGMEFVVESARKHLVARPADKPRAEYNLYIHLLNYYGEA